MKAVKLDDESTGICPLGDCRKPAYPHGAYPHDGYVDACEDHAQIVWDGRKRITDGLSVDSLEDLCIGGEQ